MLTIIASLQEKDISTTAPTNLQEQLRLWKPRPLLNPRWVVVSARAFRRERRRRSSGLLLLTGRLLELWIFIA